MSASILKVDQSGNTYVQVGSGRITYVPQSRRQASKDWAGSDVIRIQAYKEDGSKALHLGAEFPVKDEHAFLEFVGALCAVYLGR